jgi:hypothetical protein
MSFSSSSPFVIFTKLTSNPLPNTHPASSTIFGRLLNFVNIIINKNLKMSNYKYLRMSELNISLRMKLFLSAFGDSPTSRLGESNSFAPKRKRNKSLFLPEIAPVGIGVTGAVIEAGLE